MKTLYTIKPLEWVQGGTDWWRAITLSEPYFIYERGTEWKLSGCGDGMIFCTSLELAKSHAEADWITRISKALEAYPTTQPKALNER